MLELIGWVPSTDQRKPLGVVLISQELCCAICRQELTLRKDRPASVVVYDENLGTVPGSHTLPQDLPQQAVWGHTVLWILYYWA